MDSQRFDFLIVLLELGSAVEKKHADDFDEDIDEEWYEKLKNLK